MPLAPKFNVYKPIRLRGTPLWAFTNKVTLAFALGIVISSGLGYLILVPSKPLLNDALYGIREDCLPEFPDEWTRKDAFKFRRAEESVGKRIRDHYSQELTEGRSAR